MSKSLSNIAASFVRELSSDTDVKDVLTFLEAPWGLNFNKNTLPLLPAQRFILKLYYKIPLNDKEKLIKIPDKYNERILYRFTEEEYLRYLYKEGRCNIQYQDDKQRNELVLIAGRRASKSTLAGMIAAYETYKLLRLYHPQKFYKMIPDDEIQIISIATSEDQANQLFRKVTAHFAKCTYFHRYMNKPTSDKVLLKSRRDIEKSGENAKPTLVVRSAPCSARSLRGSGNILVIMDEQAHFLEEKSQSNKSDKEIYNAITPSVAQFSPDGKIINISSPLNKSGLLWDLYNSALEGSENILMIKAPTWEINSTIDSNYLKSRYRLDPIAYDCEFGAEFSDRIKSWMPEEYLRNVIVPGLKQKSGGKLRTPYYMGVDIGLKRDGTAIAITHIENVKEEDSEGKLVSVNKIELDYCEEIRAGEGQYKDLEVLDFEVIADWIETLCKKFYVVKGMIDQHNGALAVQNLAKRKLSQFDLINHSRNFNSELYQNFMMLTLDKKVRMYNEKPTESEDSPMIEEMLKLQVRQYSKNVISVEAPKVRGAHDDMSDAVVRSVWLATEIMKKGFIGGMNTLNNRYMNILDSNQYQLRKARLHNIIDNKRSIRRRKNDEWKKGWKGSSR